MKHIERLPKPKILADKEAEWQRKYEERLADDPLARPDGSKYAHPKIKETLYSMSFGKCFYCESKLSGGIKEVDHFVEVSIDHSKAYEWDNLYLACSNCNDKYDHNAIPVNDVLDPCRDSDEEIKRHITFVAEQITPVNASVKGLKTIKKFRLDKEVMDLRRGRVLRNLANDALFIQGRMISEGRRVVSEEERQIVRRYMSPDQPFSLMCEVFIKKHLHCFIA